MTGFLDSEATFLGVILTLNVLCLFASKDNNFIFGLLGEQWNKFTATLTNLQKSISDDKEKLSDDDKYKAIHDFVAEESRSSSKLYQSALEIVFGLDSALQNIRADLSPYNIARERIEKSNEQLRAPFFTFLFGIVVFSADMIYTWLDSDSAKAILPALWIFTLLSIIYWAAIWGAFCVRNIDKDKSVRYSNKFWEKADKRFKWHKGSGIKILLCAGLASVILATCTITLMSPFLAFAAVIALLLLPICIIGICRLISCGIKGNYSAMHTLGHVAAFVVYSISLALVYNTLGEDVCDSLFYNCDALIGCIIFFALINSIICPFILPYHKYRRFYNMAMTHLSENRVKLSYARSSFEKDFNEWCAKKVLSENKAKEKRKK